MCHGQRGRVLVGTGQFQITLAVIYGSRFFFSTSVFRPVSNQRTRRYDTPEYSSQRTDLFNIRDTFFRLCIVHGVSCTGWIRVKKKLGIHVSRGDVFIIFVLVAYGAKLFRDNDIGIAL